MKIKSALATQILNSRSQPTIQITIKTEQGKFGASAPSGASVGKREIQAYTTTLQNSINHFNKTIIEKIKIPINSFNDLNKIESLGLIKSLGGNPAIALEYAILRALAYEQNKEIYQLINPRAKKVPMPLGNAIGGGTHGGNSDIQEILFAPQCKTFREAANINTIIHKLTKKALAKQDKTFRAKQTDEGAWISSLPAVTQLEIAEKINQYAATKFKKEILLGIDLAASQLYRDRVYRWKNFSYAKKRHALTLKQQYGLMGLLAHEFDLCYIEDPFEETDFNSFSKLTATTKTLVCADDLTCTNTALLKRALKSNSCNAVIIKPNQIGSLIKTVEFSRTAKRAGLKTIVSHRSGTTMDTTLAHIALALQADFFKCGIAGRERVAKIKELVRLEKLVRKG